MDKDEKIEELYQRIFELEEVNRKLKEELNKHIKEGIEKDLVIDRAIKTLKSNIKDCNYDNASISALNILQGSDKE